MVCPAVKVQDRFQLLIGLPRLVMLTFAPKPPGHWLLIVYETWQPDAAWAEVTAVRLRPAAARVIAVAAANHGRLILSLVFTGGLLECGDLDGACRAV